MFYILIVLSAYNMYVHVWRLAGARRQFQNDLFCHFVAVAARLLSIVRICRGGGEGRGWRGEMIE